MEQSAPLRPMDPAMIMPGAHMGRLMMPRMDPRRGKELFVTKGWVACHAINGIGGHDAPTHPRPIPGFPWRANGSGVST